MRIPGLCVGIGGVTVGKNICGTLIFMRGDLMIDKERYKIYRDKVLLPFIRRTRTEFGKWVSGETIPEYLKVASWCDGDPAQVDNIVSDESLVFYLENSIVVCKK